MLRRGTYIEQYYRYASRNLSEQCGSINFDNRAFKLKHIADCPLHNKLQYKVGGNLGVNETHIYILQTGDWLALYKLYSKNYIMFTGDAFLWKAGEYDLIEASQTTLEIIRK